ncbi:MAG: hypothetical protein IKH16_11760 [Selenomonadaceae bacterium]|nr:hypothetical protein [Selenomonadaceae bacterium]MBR4696242.1 hypothetical protein [Selenomonadaceae bacterium]
MNIKDIIITMESKLDEIDALFDSYNEAEKEGQKFKAHGIAKDAEKIAEEIEKLAYAMDDSDVDEILKEMEHEVIQDTVDFLMDKTNALNKLVVEYAEATKSEDQLNARRKLKELKGIANEIAHVAE